MVADVSRAANLSRRGYRTTEPLDNPSALRDS